jgi:hypothetical protein
MEALKILDTFTRRLYALHAVSIDLWRLDHHDYHCSIGTFSRAFYTP